MRVTPVPIPNTMVKTQAADGTSLETVRESRWPPNLKKKNILVLFFGLFNLIFLVLKCRGMLGSMLWALVFSIGLLQIEVIINRKEND